MATATTVSITASKRRKTNKKPTIKDIRGVLDKAFARSSGFENRTNKSRLETLHRNGSGILRLSHLYSSHTIDRMVTMSVGVVGTTPLLGKSQLQRGKDLAKKFTLKQVQALADAKIPMMFIMPLAAPTKKIEPVLAVRLMVRESKKSKRKRDYRAVITTLGGTPPPYARRWSMAAPHMRSGSQCVAYGGNNVKAAIYKFLTRLKFKAKISSNDALLNATFGAFRSNSKVSGYLQASTGDKDYQNRVDKLITAGAHALGLR